MSVAREINNSLSDVFFFHKSNHTNHYQANDRLPQNTQLRVDESIEDPKGLYKLTLQQDGNLVLYDTTYEEALWASGTAGPMDPDILAVQEDGTVLYNKVGKPYWVTDTWGGGGSRTVLVMQTDGNLILYADNDRNPLWTSNTVDNPPRRNREPHSS
ncbi:hypothetical protein BX600DRAFT_442587 [Xylariales sp. PMI_506]|nr:hypothetical protein BX600DRAFT_442587 [Xylariales sp. PMI_506]